MQALIAPDFAECANLIIAFSVILHECEDRHFTMYLVSFKCERAVTIPRCYQCRKAYHSGYPVVQYFTFDIVMYVSSAESAQTRGASELKLRAYTVKSIAY